MIDELGAQIEFLSLVECTLLDGKMAGIVVLQEVYNVILYANNMMNFNCNRQKNVTIPTSWNATGGIPQIKAYE